MKDPAPSIYVSPENVAHYRQNRCSLIASDLKRYGVDEHATYAILVARGVAKWFAVRRELIKLKNVWRQRQHQSQAAIRASREAKREYRLGYERGYLAALTECRQEVRALCHSHRWRASDIDGGLQRWLLGVAPSVIYRSPIAARLREHREVKECAL